MKLLSIIKGISLGFVFLAGFIACKKSSDLVLSPDQLTKQTYLVFDSKGNDTLFLNNPSKTVTVTVHAYDETVNTITVYVSTNNSTAKSTWKKIKDFPVTGTQPVTLSVTPAEIATALGSPIPNGAAYTLYNEITTLSGDKFGMYNMNGEFESAPDYHMGMRWNVFAPCTWDNTPFTGDVVILDDNGWADYAPGEIVYDALQPGPGVNQFQIRIYPSPAYGSNPQWVTVDVNPATLTPSISEQYVGDYGSTQATMRTTSPGGQVNPCSGTIDIRNMMIRYVGGTDYGPYKLVFKKL